MSLSPPYCVLWMFFEGALPPGWSIACGTPALMPKLYLPSHVPFISLSPSLSPTFCFTSEQSYPDLQHPVRPLTSHSDSIYVPPVALVRPGKGGWTATARYSSSSLSPAGTLFCPLEWEGTKVKEREREKRKGDGSRVERIPNERSRQNDGWEWERLTFSSSPPHTRSRGFCSANSVSSLCLSSWGLCEKETDVTARETEKRAEMVRQLLPRSTH